MIYLTKKEEERLAPIIDALVCYGRLPGSKTLNLEAIRECFWNEFKKPVGSAGKIYPTGEKTKEDAEILDVIAPYVQHTGRLHGLLEEMGYPNSLCNILFEEVKMVEIAPRKK